MSERSAPRYTLIGTGIIALVVAVAAVLARPAHSEAQKQRRPPGQHPAVTGRA
jgi:zinc protease